MAELPAFPAVVLSLLEATARGDAGPREIETIIARDSTLVARLLGAANAAAYTRSTPTDSLREAIARLGLSRINTLAVATAVRGFFQALDRGQPVWVEALWRHGLLCAQLARELARARANSCPETAYLAGLLHDVGKPVMGLARPEEYQRLLADAEASDRGLQGLEQARWGCDHSQVGAELLADWGFPALLIDAVRYHHQPVPALEHAHPLVRCVALANLLCHHPEVDVTGRQAAARLLDLGREDTQTLVTAAQHELAKTCTALGEDDAASDLKGAHERVVQRLGDQVRTAALTGGLGAALAEGDTLESLAICVALLFGVRHLLVLEVDETGERLSATAMPANDPAISELSLPLETAASPIAALLLEDRIAPLKTPDPGAIDQPVADRQVLDRLPGEAALGLPLYSEGRPVAALILGLSHGQLQALQAEAPLLRTFAAQAGALLARRQREDQAVRQAREEASAQQRRREAELVKATANPITVMQNYLSVLQQQLEADHPGQSGVSALRDEVERIRELISELEPTVDGNPANP
ncbi:HDOD domain-containing protein [Alkalilimnicola ehrlichii MLHE-1]|uniref:HDOD domain-containing protein n=1 Tax=Alkalilimnicola ehrlichii TaxID=351052 RepID=UPI0018DD0599|nr:HDOD domain-containing protein [Alkalilimnicola ehrlichii]